MAMQTNQLHSKSRFGSSIKKTLAFAVLGFQVLVSPMNMGCVTGNLPTTATTIAPKKDKDKLDLELLDAAEKGDKKAVEKLLAEGADVNAKVGILGDTALIHASANGHMEIAELLIAKGADMNAKDENGWTALMWASSQGYKETAELLIAKGADVNAKDNDGWTPLMSASKQGRTEIIELLKKHGAKE